MKYFFYKVISDIHFCGFIFFIQIFHNNTLLHRFAMITQFEIKKKKSKFKINYNKIKKKNKNNNNKINNKKIIIITKK